MKMISSSASNKQSAYSFRHIALRGGRLTKHAGRVTSFAPLQSIAAVCVGGAGVVKRAAAAVGGAVLLGLTVSGPANSGVCIADAVIANTYGCTGASLNPDAPITISISGSANQFILDEDGTFEQITDGTSTAMSITNVTGAGASIDLGSATVTGGSNGITIDNQSGALSLESSGTISSTASNGTAVTVTDSSDAATAITVNDIAGGNAGFSGTVSGSNTDLTFMANNVSTSALSGNAIFVDIVGAGVGTVSITTTGTVSSTGNLGVYIYNTGLNTDAAVDVENVDSASGGVFIYGYYDGVNSDASIVSTGYITTNATNATSYDAIGAHIKYSGDASISVNDITATSSGVLIEGVTGTADVTVSGVVQGAVSTDLYSTVFGHGIKIDNAGSTYTGTINLNDGASVNGSTDGVNSPEAIFNDGGAVDVTVNTGAEIVGAVSLGDGVDSLDFAGGSFSSITTADAGADASIDALSFSGSDGQINPANFTNFETISISNGSDISVVGNSLTYDSVSVLAGGTLTDDNAATGDALTINGDFVGGGTVALDVDFENDASDTLVINGDVSGAPTSLSLNDVTAGASTGEDILVVDVNGTVAAADFVLAGGSLTNGVWVYDIENRGSEFFLVGASNPGGGGGTQVGGTGQIYAEAPDILNGLNRLDSFAARINSRVTNDNNAFVKGSGAGALSDISLSPWVRFVVDSLQATTDVSGTIGDVEQLSTGFQAGFDFIPSADSDWVFGLSAQYKVMSGEVAGGGEIDGAHFGFGGTATWHNDDNVYVDVQGLVSSTDADFSSTTGSLVTGQSAQGYALSAEWGQLQKVGENSAFIPQVQFEVSGVDAGGFTDANALVVDIDAHHLVNMRFGAAYEFNTDSDQRYYVKGDFLHRWSNSKTVGVDANNLRGTLEKRTWAELGVGGSLPVAGMEVFGEVAARTALGIYDGTNVGMSAALGLRKSW